MQTKKKGKNIPGLPRDPEDGDTQVVRKRRFLTKKVTAEKTQKLLHKKTTAAEAFSRTYSTIHFYLQHEIK
jgi:hypothetical protein